MLQVTGQLERVRWAGRALLVAQRVLQWLTAVEVALLAAGLIDFGLRLPSWFRLLVGVAAGLTAVFWIVTRLGRALAVRPDLGALALRAEQLHPQLSGLLASGVEFGLHPERYADTPRTAALANASIQQLQARLGAAPLRGILNPAPTIRRTALFLGMTLVVAGVAGAWPDAAAIAWRRWVTPLGSTQWPRRTDIKSLVTQSVWPSDSPLRLGARIDKGYYPAMRAWVVYRFVNPRAGRSAKSSSLWQWALMNEQTGSAASVEAPDETDAAQITQTSAARRGSFERLLDPPAALQPAGSAAIPIARASAGSVEFHFQAGDDQTSNQTIRLVDRPALRGVKLVIDPPAYARGLVNSQEIDLDQQNGQVATATALVGSEVRWILELNKPIPQAWINSDQFVPGLQGMHGLNIQASAFDSQASTAPQVELVFNLRQTVQTPIRLQDDYGLSNLSDRLYRLEATVDQPPAVSMTLPAGDESVLATAAIPLEAVAQDDVGLESVEIQLQKAARDQPGASESPATAHIAVTPSPVALAQTTGRAARLTVAYQLDLSTLALQPGDEVDVTGVARDVYDLDGMHHDPVRSLPRHLRVIDSGALSSAIWNDLQGVRLQAMRLESDQRDLAAKRVIEALPGQREMGRRIDTQSQLVHSLAQRVAENRLNDAGLTQVLQKAASLLEQSSAAARAAAASLDEARRNPIESEGPRANAKQKQEEVSKALTALISALDQGRDTTATELQLRALAAQLAAVNRDIHEALPQTLGKAPEQLTPQERQRLDALAQRQTALEMTAEALVRSMDAAAAALSQSKDAQQQATAQALSDAADTARRQDLSANMQTAAESAKANQLADAASSNNASQATLRDMLNQLGNTQERSQEVLRRQLAALTEAIQKLIDQQKAQLDVLNEAAEIHPLEQPQELLRENTLAVEDQAKAARETGGAVQSLDQAGDHQGLAVAALHDAKRDPAEAGEKLALTSLEAALAQVQQKARENQARQNQEAREKLQAQYEKLAKDQDQLQAKTQALVEMTDLSRRQRADLIDLGQHEADLQASVADLRDQVEQTILFVRLHDRIDALAGSVVRRMRRALAEPDITSDQGRIAFLLRTMAAALAEAQQKEPYSSPQSKSAGGGGGGGGGQKIPPAAELKLLRDLQEDVFEQTRKLAAQQPATPDDADRRDHDAIELSAQQRELSALGERLIEQMQPHGNESGAKAPGTE